MSSSSPTAPPGSRRATTRTRSSGSCVPPAWRRSASGSSTSPAATTSRRCSRTTRRARRTSPCSTRRAGTRWAAGRPRAHDGRLRDAIAGAGSTSPAAATDFHLSAGDQWLNGIEWLLRTAATPLQALAPQSVIAARRESIKEVAAKGPLDIDFTVLRTNWYWRHQTRIYRMSTQGIIRIGPELMDKRDSMPYASIAKLVCSGERNLVIVFKADARHSPEYIETPNRDDIVRLILERTPGQKPVVETA